MDSGAADEAGSSDSSAPIRLSSGFKTTDLGMAGISRAALAAAIPDMKMVNATTLESVKSALAGLNTASIVNATGFDTLGLSKSLTGAMGLQSIAATAAAPLITATTARNKMMLDSVYAGMPDLTAMVNATIAPAVTQMKLALAGSMSAADLMPSISVVGAINAGLIDQLKVGPQIRIPTLAAEYVFSPALRSTFADLAAVIRASPQLDLDVRGFATAVQGRATFGRPYGAPLASARRVSETLAADAHTADALVEPLDRLLDAEGLDDELLLSFDDAIGAGRSALARIRGIHPLHLLVAVSLGMTDYFVAHAADDSPWPGRVFEAFSVGANAFFILYGLSGQRKTADDSEH